MKTVVQGEKHRCGMMRGNRAGKRISKRKERRVRRQRTRWRRESCRGKASIWREGRPVQGDSTYLGDAFQGQSWKLLSLQSLAGTTRENIAGGEGKQKCWKGSHRVYLALKLPGKSCCLQWAATALWFPWNSRRWMGEILSPFKVNG